jgi:hypothetical protein
MMRRMNDTELDGSIALPVCRAWGRATRAVTRSTRRSKSGVALKPFRDR